MTHPFSTNGHEFLMVDVPLNSYDFDFLTCTRLFFKLTGGGTDTIEIKELKNFKIANTIGSYFSQDRRIDFFVKDEWVGELKKRNPFTIQQAFLELIESEIAKRWHCKTNPHGEHEPQPSGEPPYQPYYMPYGMSEEEFRAEVMAAEIKLQEWEMENSMRLQQWQESQSKVVPSRVLIIKIK